MSEYAGIDTLRPGDRGWDLDLWDAEVDDLDPDPDRHREITSTKIGD